MYIRLHVENIKVDDNRIYEVTRVTYDNEINDGNFYSVNKRNATFEYISERQIDCSAYELGPNLLIITRHWLHVEFTTTLSDGRVFTEMRYVPIKCFGEIPSIPSPPTTLPLDETTVDATTVQPITTIFTTAQTPTPANTIASDEVPTGTEFPTTTIAEVITTTNGVAGPTESLTTIVTIAEEITTNPFLQTTETAGIDCTDTEIQRPSLVIAVSSKYSIQDRNSFLTGVSGLDPGFAEKNYDKFLVTLFDNDGFDYSNASVGTNYTAFQARVMQLAYDTHDPLSDNSNVLDVLLAIVKDSNVNPNSAISIMVANLTIDTDAENKKIEIIQRATTKQLKINVIMEFSYFQFARDSPGSSRDIIFYEQLAAVTDGHLLLTQPNTMFSNNGTYVLANVCYLF